MENSFTLLVVVLLSAGLKAQTAGPVSFNEYGGYVSREKVGFDGYGYVNNGFQWGGGLQYAIESAPFD